MYELKIGRPLAIEFLQGKAIDSKRFVRPPGFFGYHISLPAAHMAYFLGKGKELVFLDQLLLKGFFLGNIHIPPEMPHKTAIRCVKRRIIPFANSTIPEVDDLPFYRFPFFNYLLYP